MTIYLHVGTTKTGTTSIQEFMYNNSSKLKEKGIIYPTFLGDPQHNKSNHTRIVGYAQNLDETNIIKIYLGITDREKSKQYRQWFRELFSRKLNQGEQTYVISSEHCSSLLTKKEEIERVYNLLTSTGHEVKVIFYVREQVSYLKSSFSTQVKIGSINSISYPSEGAIKNKYDYFNLVEKWASIFNKKNIIVRVFERENLKKGDVVHDFLHLVSKGSLDHQGLVFGEAKNEALGKKSVNFMRLFNERFPRVIDGNINKERGPIASYIANVENGDSITCTDAISIKLRHELSESNKKLREKFIDGAYANPFRFKIESNDRAQEVDLTVSDVMDIWSSLWKQIVKEKKG